MPPAEKVHDFATGNNQQFSHTALCTHYLLLNELATVCGYTEDLEHFHGTNSAWINAGIERTVSLSRGADPWGSSETYAAEGALDIRHLPPTMPHPRRGQREPARCRLSPDKP